MKILVDQCLSQDWIQHLERQGFEAIRWGSIGRPDDPDLLILEHAADHDYVILTRDLDFSNLLAWYGLKKPSVIQLRTGDALPGGCASLVIRALSEAKDQIHLGAIVSIEVLTRKIRVKALGD